MRILGLCGSSLLVRVHHEFEPNIRGPFSGTDLSLELQKPHDETEGSCRHRVRLGIFRAYCVAFVHELVRERTNDRKRGVFQVGQILLHICNHRRILLAADHSRYQLLIGVQSRLHPGQETAAIEIGGDGACRIIGK